MNRGICKLVAVSEQRRVHAPTTRLGQQASERPHEGGSSAADNQAGNDRCHDETDDAPARSAMHHGVTSASQAARHVFRPTTPSISSRFSRWNCSTIRSVSEPKMPSAESCQPRAFMRD